jgi:heterodisulfide reductase subunit A
MSEEVRIGVFICDCGSNIASVVDVPKLVEYARTLEHVVLADEGKWSCSVDYINRFKELIQQHELNRVVIASCTPRTHEPLFKRATKEAGVNPYLLEFVSIREQVSWVHRNAPHEATEKAKDLVKMGVAKAALLEEGQEIQLPVRQECLVIGGGITGMNAALSVADQGFTAYLVERENRLGGLLNSISVVASEQHTMPAADIVRDKVAQIESHPNITVFTETEIEAIDGYIGNYDVTLKRNGTEEKLAVSTIVVATGMRELPPDGLFHYGEDPRVVTQLQLERLLKDGLLGDVHDVVMINCVNSKNETRGCCNIGCHVSVRHAIMLKEHRPEMNVHVLYRDLSLTKAESKDVETAKALGVKFLRFADDRYPEVGLDDGELTVEVRDILLGRTFRLSPELLVLTTAFTGSDTVDRLKGHLKVSANSEGFFQESHVKLGPLEFPTDGIALGGCARAPKTFVESSQEGIGAAMRVSIPMKRGYIEAEGIVAHIDLAECNQCGLCFRKCPFNAIRLDGEKNPEVIQALCKGCGLCAADCPMDCVDIVHYSDAQVIAQVDAALEEHPDQKIIAYVCHWCALGGVDMAGVSRLQYPTNARLIRVMCSARVSVGMIRHAFERGAAGVLVVGCEFPTCHYISGNYAAERRIRKAKLKLSKADYDPDRLWNVWCSAADGPKFANTMREMVEALGLEQPVDTH